VFVLLTAIERAEVQVEATQPEDLNLARLFELVNLELKHGLNGIGRDLKGLDKLRVKQSTTQVRAKVSRRFLLAIQPRFRLVAIKVFGSNDHVHTALTAW